MCVLKDVDKCVCVAMVAWMCESVDVCVRCVHTTSVRAGYGLMYLWLCSEARLCSSIFPQVT